MSTFQASVAPRLVKVYASNVAAVLNRNRFQSRSDILLTTWQTLDSRAVTRALARAGLADPRKEFAEKFGQTKLMEKVKTATQSAAGAVEVREQLAEVVQIAKLAKATPEPRAFLNQAYERLRSVPDFEETVEKIETAVESTRQASEEVRKVQKEIIALKKSPEATPEQVRATEEILVRKEAEVKQRSEAIVKHEKSLHEQAQSLDLSSSGAVKWALDAPIKKYGIHQEKVFVEKHEIVENNSKVYTLKIDEHSIVAGKTDGKDKNGNFIEVKHRRDRLFQQFPEYELVQMWVYLEMLEAEQGTLRQVHDGKESSMVVTRNHQWWSREAKPQLSAFAEEVRGLAAASIEDQVKFLYTVPSIQKANAPAAQATTRRY